MTRDELIEKAREYLYREDQPYAVSHYEVPGFMADFAIKVRDEALVAKDAEIVTAIERLRWTPLREELKLDEYERGWEAALMAIKIDLEANDAK